MDIGSIMKKEVVTVEMDDSLKTISQIFDNVKFHHLLVVSKNRLRGVISDRDLLKASSPFINTLSEQSRDIAILNRPAHQIMSKKLVTTTKETSLEDAVALLLLRKVSCLPVISPDGQIEGIVTWRDIIKVYLLKLDIILQGQSA